MSEMIRVKVFLIDAYGGSEANSALAICKLSGLGADEKVRKCYIYLDLHEYFEHVDYYSFTISSCEHGCLHLAPHRREGTVVPCAGQAGHYLLIGVSAS